MFVIDLFLFSSLFRFNIDLILRDSEHDIKPLWLPPYHCHFNPIELVWGIVKAHFEANVGRCGDSEEAMMRVWEEALDSITPSVWANCVRHTDDLIEACFKSECQFETPDQTDYSQFKISLGDDDFGIEDDEESEPEVPSPDTTENKTKRSLPFAAGLPTSQSVSITYSLSLTAGIALCIDSSFSFVTKYIGPK